MADQAPQEATKPSNPGFVGFDGAPPAEISIKEAKVVEPAVPVNVERAPVGSASASIRIIEWKLKQPPVAMETCAVVINTRLFAESTLDQLRIVLTQPKRRVGWTVPQLIDRLAQVGVQVTLEANSKV
jgi:hypothetical protein